MEITMKTVRGDEFAVTVQAEWTVLQVKEELVKLKQYALAGIKLICAGKVLKDTQTLSAVGVTAGSFMVVMVSKPKKAKKAKAAPKPAAAAAAPAPAAAAAPAPAAAAAAAAAAAPAPAATPAPTATPATPAPVPAAAAPAAPAVSDAQSAAAASLAEMGFPLEQATIALRAAFGDVSRAAEYLFNPSSMPAMPAMAAAAAPAATGGVAATPAASGTAATPAAPAKPVAADDPLAELRTHKQLKQIKAVIQKDPSKIKAVLDQIGKTKPELLKKINENMEAFIELMNEPDAPAGSAAGAIAAAAPAAGGAPGAPGAMPAGMQAGMQAAIQQMQDMPPAARAQLEAMMAQMTPEQLQQVMMQMMGGMAGAGGVPGMPGAGGVPPGATQIQLTQEEANDVDFLSELIGGDKQRALEAYLSCDKNKEMAANLLLGGF